MPSVETKTGRAYWRSLEDRAQSPEFQEFVSKEFPNFSHDAISETTRRQFLQLMGASLALAGLTGCRWPEEKIAPFSHRPEGRTPGVAQFFATARELDGVGTGLVVTSYDGRPIKVEGNELHPYSLGSADIHAQAMLLEMYDPDRSQSPLQRAGGQTVVKKWADFDAFAAGLFSDLRKLGGEGFWMLSESTASPSVESLRKRIAETMPKARWVEYEPTGRENERTGTALAFGRPMRPIVDFKKAKAIVCLDADPLMTHPAALRAARDFAEGRRPEAKEMSRLYVFEPSFTITGTMADHRYPAAASAIPAMAAHLAAEIAKAGKGAGAAGAASGATAGALAKLAGVAGLDRFSDHPESLGDLPAIARDLWSRKGECVVVAGPRQPAEVHALVALMNDVLGAGGDVVRYAAEPDPERPSHVDGLRALTNAAEGGEVKTLLILGGNPVFNAPADLDFATALSRVETSIHLSLYDDETSRRCGWHAPRAHALESWGDTRAWDGTYSIVQPLIAPLYDGKTPIELLEMAASDKPVNGYAIAQRTFRKLHGEKDFAGRWEQALHDGVLADSAPAAGDAPQIRIEKLAAWLGALSPEPAAPTKDAVEIVFQRDLKLHDGRFANSGWLQELADPVTKLTWDNSLYLGPATAEALGLNHGDVARVSLGGREMELPVFILPGQAPFSATISLGYGREAAGRVGNKVGFDTYRLRASDGMDLVAGATVAPAGRAVELATTQDHNAIDRIGHEERTRRSLTLVRSVDVGEYRHEPKESVEHLGTHYPKDTQLFPAMKHDTHRWAMAIDLNVCTGCSACVTACQAENNTPIVGKEQVVKNREMHWIRVDRYFQGDPENPKAVQNPLMCVHCENAPCEQVCPVAATVHSTEGLNVMVYNRCIGTRYCSNNCPYKVRRFNFFNYHKAVPEVQKLMYNPEVTIRARGVMEKCTYCVQRIEKVKIEAKNGRRAIRDGEIKTACEQTCPTQAIVFGDLSDSTSRVARLHQDPRAYEMLGELLVIPRTRYLARLRNPNPEIRVPSHEQEPIHEA